MAEGLREGIRFEVWIRSNPEELLGKFLEPVGRRIDEIDLREQLKQAEHRAEEAERQKKQAESEKEQAEQRAKRAEKRARSYKRDLRQLYARLQWSEAKRERSDDEYPICPECGEKMGLLPNRNEWRCPICDHSQSTSDE
jgi:rubrerythrin